MGTHYCHLKLDERRKLAKWLEAKIPVKEIADNLQRAPSTIYREIRRNTYSDTELPQLNGYHALGRPPQSAVLTGILPLQVLATIGANQLPRDSRRIDKVAKGGSNIWKVHTPLQHRIPALLCKGFFRLMLTL